LVWITKLPVLRTPRDELWLRKRNCLGQVVGDNLSGCDELCHHLKERGWMCELTLLRKEKRFTIAFFW
jgi:hypothetical protein